MANRTGLSISIYLSRQGYKTLRTMANHDHRSVSNFVELLVLNEHARRQNTPQENAADRNGLKDQLDVPKHTLPIT